MFPDLVIVRADSHGYVFDILEPHDPSRKDNYPKQWDLLRSQKSTGINSEESNWYDLKRVLTDVSTSIA